MKTIQQIRPKKKWKIVDEQGRLIKGGFRTRTCAEQSVARFKIGKHDPLRAIEE